MSKKAILKLKEELQKPLPAAVKIKMLKEISDLVDKQVKEKNEEVIKILSQKGKESKTKDLPTDEE